GRRLPFLLLFFVGLAAWVVLRLVGQAWHSSVASLPGPQVPAQGDGFLSGFPDPMKCQQVQPWLLTVKASAALPEAARTHLDDCATCRQQWQQLERLEEQVSRMAVPPANPAAKEQLWERLDRTPRPVKHLSLLKRRNVR